MGDQKPIIDNPEPVLEKYHEKALFIISVL
jgi:hypothetical protein